MNSDFLDSIKLLAGHAHQFGLPMQMLQIAAKDRRFHAVADAITQSHSRTQIIDTVNQLNKTRSQKEKARQLEGNPRQRRAPNSFLAAMKVAVNHRGRKVALRYAKMVKAEAQPGSPLEKQAKQLMRVLGKRHTNKDAIIGIACLARRKRNKAKKMRQFDMNIKPGRTLQPQKAPVTPESTAPYIVWMTPKA